MPPQNFQTSFIPKKPLAEPVVRQKFTIGIFGFIGLIVFVLTAASAGGIYVYQKNIVQQLSDKQAQLNNARNSIESPFIDEAKTLGRRITDANEILSNHIIVSPIFQALQINTLKTVQFTHFQYETPQTPKDPIKISMSGIARDYTSIALESDQLAKNKNIQNPLFSGLALDPATGNVTFSLDFTVTSDFVNFAKHASDYAVLNSASSTDVSAGNSANQ